MQPEPSASTPAAADRSAIGARLAAVSAFLVVVSVLTAFCGTCVAVMAGARAYATAAGEFGRGQKNAVILLQDYLDSRNEADFDAARRALAAPLKARPAREAILSDDFDYDTARSAFASNPDSSQDARAMIFLGRLARRSAAAQPALEVWADADAAMADLARVANEIHQAVLAAPLSDGQRRAFALRLFQLNDRLEGLEGRFSGELATGARWVQSALITASLVLAIFLTVTRVLFMRTMAERLSRSHAWILEGNARWALAAKASNLGLLDWRPDTDTTLLDDQARAMFGIEDAPAGPLPAGFIRRHVHEDDRRALRDASEAAMALPGPTTRRFRVPRPDGSCRTLEMSARALSDASGAATHMLGLVRDVSHDVDAERLRTEEAAAQRANEMKSRFFAQVSHELRTPLNAVLGFSELLRDDPAETLSPGQHLRLNQVIAGGQFLLQLVNDLLDRASLEEGQLSVTPRVVVLRDVIRTALGMLEPISTSRGVRVDSELPPGSLHVQADPKRLTQVLVNVLSNATKYNRSGGAIFLRWRVDGDNVVVAIRDEGAGLSETQQRDLFMPFRRLGAEATAVEGAGLGLVISRHLMERQGGELALESQPGQGTTACLKLRVVHAATPAGAEDVARIETPAPASRSGVVLYIEDEPVNVLLVQQYLQTWPAVELLVATTGESGLARVRERRPDLILLDMQLPDMTGLEIIETLAADAATRTLPILVLSASAMSEETSRAMLSGIQGYLTKPIGGDKLREEVGKFLR